MFYERLEALCKQHNTTVSVFVRDVLGLNSSSATGWKRGSSPRASVVLEAAKYFGVSTDYLLGRSDDPTLHLEDITKMLRSTSPRSPYFEEALNKPIPLLSQIDRPDSIDNQLTASASDSDALSSIVKAFFSLKPSSRPSAAAAICEFIKAINAISMEADNKK